MRNSIETANKIIGKSFADRLGEPVLVIGEIEFSRQEMIDNLGCGNFAAAMRVSKHLKKLDITTVQKLWDTSPPDLLRVKGLGATQMWVLMCLLDFSGKNVRVWWKWDNNETKFSSYRHRVLARAKKRG